MSLLLSGVRSQYPPQLSLENTMKIDYDSL